MITIKKLMQRASTTLHLRGSGTGRSTTTTSRARTRSGTKTATSSWHFLSKSCNASSATMTDGSSDNNKEYLLDRLGGMDALSSILNAFFHRIMDDPRLADFFEGIDRAILVSHQKRFFSTAFTDINRGTTSVATLIRNRHKHLFEQRGLNQDHFDIFVETLLAILKERGFHEPIIMEVYDTITPLRIIFEKEAQNSKKQISKQMKDTSDYWKRASTSSLTQMPY